MTAAVTPLEALRRLIAVAKWPDAHWFSSEADWNEYQGELGVAEMVVRDAAAPVAPVAAQPVAPVPHDEHDSFITAYRQWQAREAPNAHPEMVLYMSESHWNRAAGAMWRARAAIAAPSLEAQPAGEVVRDAARWRQVLRYVGADRSPALMFSYFVLRGIHAVPGTNLMRGGVAGHFTEAIDAAMAQGDKHDN